MHNPIDGADQDATPVDEALAHLGKLIAARASPDKVTAEVGGLIAGWAAEPDFGPAQAQQRIERLWDSLSKDAADLQEQIADADDSAGLAVARQMLAAMNAAVAALAAVHGRM